MNPLLQYGNNQPMNNGFGGFNMMQQFNQFAQNFRSQSQMSPEETIRQMMASGQMTQEQFNRCAYMANSIMGSKH